MTAPAPAAESAVIVQVQEMLDATLKLAEARQFSPLRCSPQADQLFAALCEAQAAFPTATRETDNAFTGKKYADLATVQAAVQPKLHENGLGLISYHRHDDRTDGWILTTRLFHRSGQWIESDAPIAPPPPEPTHRPGEQGQRRADGPRNPMQVFGSGSTYGIRYNLKALLNVRIGDDDDDAHAMGDDRPQGPPQGRGRPPRDDRRSAPQRPRPAPAPAGEVAPEVPNGPTVAIPDPKRVSLDQYLMGEARAASAARAERGEPRITSNQIMAALVERGLKKGTIPSDARGDDAECRKIVVETYKKSPEAFAKALVKVLYGAPAPADQAGGQGEQDAPPPQDVAGPTETEAA